MIWLLQFARCFVVLIIAFCILMYTDFWPVIQNNVSLLQNFQPSKFTILVLIFSVFSLLPLSIEIRLKKKIIRLKQQGQFCRLPVLHVLTNLSQNNRALVYFIYQEWTHPQTGEKHGFFSEVMKYHPGPFMQNKQATIWFNPDKPNDYWIDTEEFDRLYKAAKI